MLIAMPPVPRASLTAAIALGLKSLCSTRETDRRTGIDVLERLLGEDTGATLTAGKQRAIMKSIAFERDTRSTSADVDLIALSSLNDRLATKFSSLALGVLLSCSRYIFQDINTSENGLVHCLKPWIYHLAELQTSPRESRPRIDSQLRQVIRYLLMAGSLSRPVSSIVLTSAWPMMTDETFFPLNSFDGRCAREFGQHLADLNSSSVSSTTITLHSLLRPASQPPLSTNRLTSPGEERTMQPLPWEAWHQPWSRLESTRPCSAN